MYCVAHRRHAFDHKDAIVLSGHIETIAEAAALRAVSGDIVCHADTLLSVDSDEWLWDFERTDPTCYARRCIVLDRKHLDLATGKK